MNILTHKYSNRPEKIAQDRSHFYRPNICKTCNRSIAVKILDIHVNNYRFQTHKSHKSHNQIKKVRILIIKFKKSVLKETLIHLRPQINSRRTNR